MPKNPNTTRIQAMSDQELAERAASMITARLHGLVTDSEVLLETKRLVTEATRRELLTREIR